jgi:PAS domain S-box-containing protein
MNSITIDNNKENDQKKKSLLPFYLGLLPVLLLFGLIINEHLFPSSVRVYEPEFLLPLFNTVLFLAAGFVAYIARRLYLVTGSLSILWVGCGVLTLGLGAVTAGWLIHPFGPNANVTIFNVGAFLAALCHMGAVMAGLGERPGEADLNRRSHNVRLAYLAVFIVTALLVVLTITGLTPPFFVQGKGPTVIRQNLAAWAIVLFFISALFTMNRFLRQRTSFLYWYSLALALLALSMLAFLLQPAVGSPIGWMGRSAYVFAAAYFLLSVSVGLREARTPGANLSRVMAELFGPRLHWQEILATVSDAVVSYNEQGSVLLWNKPAERIFGFPEAEVIGKGIDLIEPGLKTLGTPGFAGIKEIEPVRADGSRFNAEVSASAVSSAAGVITTLVIRDVTARQRAEEALRERTTELEYANRELESFSYSVSHDLKAPLRAIQGFSTMLAQDHAARLDQEGLRLLQVIRDNTRIMSRLIDNLLDLSRLGRWEIRAENLDLAVLVTDIFRELAEQNPERQLKLQLKPLPPARGDRTLIRQVLYNLLANAVKFTRDREVGDIEVGGRTEGGENIFFVKDNGVGFDTHYSDKLFGVFQRLHTRDQFEGTGIGLAIVQRLVRRHGGRVWAESQVDEGATFYFSLPK